MNGFAAQKARSDAAAAADSDGGANQPSAGPQSCSDFVNRWFPRALVYREWRLHRGVYALAFGLLIAGMLAPLLLSLGMALPFSIVQLQSELLALALAQPFHAESIWPPLVTGCFGVLLMRSDVVGERLHFTLTGPVRRRDLWRVKAALGTVVTVAAFTVVWLALCVLVLQYPSPATTPAVAVMGGVMFGHMLLSAAMFLTGLAAGATSRNFFLAAIGAFLAGAVPLFAADLVRFFASSLLTGAPPSVVAVAPYLDQASPLASFHTMAVRYNAFVTPVGALYTLWFLGWCYGFWKLGAWLFGAAPAQRWSETFFFPRLWSVVLAGVCFIIAYVFSHLLTGMQNGYLFLVWFVIGFGGSWLVIRRIMRGVLSRERG